MKSFFETVVAGISKKNIDGENIQSILKEYVKEYHDTNRYDKEDYDYYSDEEIENLEEHIYQYELEEIDTISLIPQPDNPYDSNAIMVVHNEMGMIGYIPRSDNVRLAKYISDNNNLITIRMKLEGGPYKYYDFTNYVVRKTSRRYYIRLYISPSISDSYEYENNLFDEKQGNSQESQSSDIDQHIHDVSENKLTSNQTTQDMNIKKQDAIITNYDHKENNNSSKAKEYKNPLKYLIAAIIYIILTFILIKTKSYLLSIISIILSIVYIKIYLESKNQKKGK